MNLFTLAVSQGTDVVRAFLGRHAARLRDAQMLDILRICEGAAKKETRHGQN